MTPGRQRVLIVEDDSKTADIVRVYLEKDGYEVLTAGDGPEGLAAARESFPDLIVLDLLLPGISGLDLCRELRREGSTPIIMLTALSTETDKLAGLDLGADDYLSKPFSPRELVARVRAVLRRAAPADGVADSQVLSYRDVSVDLGQCSVHLRGKEVRMTPTEFRILASLVREPGRVLSRAQLVDKALGYDYEGMERTVDVHILNLRRKIERDPNRPEYIRTVYGMGYKFGG